MKLINREDLSIIPRHHGDRHGVLPFDFPFWNRFFDDITSLRSRQDNDLFVLHGRNAVEIPAVGRDDENLLKTTRYLGVRPEDGFDYELRGSRPGNGGQLGSNLSSLIKACTRQHTMAAIAAGVAFRIRTARTIEADIKRSMNTSR